MPDDDPLLSPEDVQRLLQIGAETVRRRIRDGTLRAYRDGGSVSFKRSEVLNSLQPYEKESRRPMKRDPEMG